MILLSEINAAAEKFQVLAETIEKDYVISWILLCLSKSQIKNNFVFYGGTAIKRIYFEDHRFSEDIDLISEHRFSLDELLQELETLQFAREQANLILEIDPSSIAQMKDRVQLHIQYSGYDEIIGAPKRVRIDFVMHSDFYGEVIDKHIINSYGDLEDKHDVISVMTLNTILANKLGLLTDSTRNEPRDLFDIWFLLQRMNDFDFDLAKICKIYKDKYSFQPTFSVLNSGLQKPSLKKFWDVRLQKQMGKLPQIEVVINEVKVVLKELFQSNG